MCHLCLCLSLCENIIFKTAFFYSVCFIFLNLSVVLSSFDTKRNILDKCINAYSNGCQFCLDGSLKTINNVFAFGTHSQQKNPVALLCIIIICYK